MKELCYYHCVAKKPFTTKQLDKIKNDLRAELQSSVVQNGLSAAIFGAGIPGVGFGPGTNSQQVSQVTEIFNNLRWYFVSNFRQALSEAYCELGLVQTIVDVPVDDAFRGGVEVKSKQLSPEQLDMLRDCDEREGDINTVAQALKWTRLFGGGAVVIVTDQDYETPLDINAITPDSLLEFRAVDMWELYFDLQNTGGYDSAIQEERFEFYSYYGKKLHKSRVLKMKGLVVPSFLRPRLRGWGFSVVEALVRSINQYLEGTSLIYELVDEAKIDVFGIKNLTSTLLQPEGTKAVATRIQLANQQKDYQHALVMDAEDTYEQKTLTFAGLADVMKEIRIQVASDLRMPLTKVFGLSAAGFNSGEDDIEVYNGMIESTIRQKARVDVLRVLELRCQKLFGYIPDDLSISFKPLRVLSTVEEEDVKDKKHARLVTAMQAGAISLEEYRDACNKDDLLGIQLEDDNLPEDAGSIGSDTIDDVPEDGEEPEVGAPADTGSSSSSGPRSLKPHSERRRRLRSESARVEKNHPEKPEKPK